MAGDDFRKTDPHVKPLVSDYRNSVCNRPLKSSQGSLESHTLTTAVSSINILSRVLENALYLTLYEFCRLGEVMPVHFLSLLVFVT